LTIKEADSTPLPLKSKRNPLQVFARWLARKMPKGLYARSLLIIIVPMVVLQSVIAFVFMERHWQTVTQRLSKSVTSDIAAIIQVIEDYPQDPEFAGITEIARDKLGLNISILPPDPFPPAVGKPFFLRMFCAFSCYATRLTLQTAISF